MLLRQLWNEEIVAINMDENRQLPQAQPQMGRSHKVVCPFLLILTLFQTFGSSYIRCWND